MSEQQLKKEIIKRSESNEWETARLEWELEDIYESSEPDNCLCGHYPIKEICVLINSNNKNLVIVGNECVNKFLGLRSDKIFKAIKKIKTDKEKSLNIEAIQYAKNKRWISDKEFSFLVDTIRKRKLSPKQLNLRKKLNSKISYRWDIASIPQKRSIKKQPIHNNRSQQVL